MKESKKPKGAPDWHESDAPDAEGRFKDLGIKDLAAWLIKTRKKDLKKISGSLTQQIVFNRKKDPKYAEKMEKVRKEVYKQLGRKDLLDERNTSGVIVCNNCGWSWDLATGGDDPYNCHECGNENNQLEEMKISSVKRFGDFLNEDYFKGISKSTASKKKAQMKKQADMDDDDPEAYKEMPGDKKGKKTSKTSKHTKKYHELYDELDEGKFNYDKDSEEVETLFTKITGRPATDLDNNMFARSGGSADGDGEGWMLNVDDTPIPKKDKAKFVDAVMKLGKKKGWKIKQYGDDAVEIYESVNEGFDLVTGLLSLAGAIGVGLLPFFVILGPGEILNPGALAPGDTWMDVFRHYKKKFKDKKIAKKLTKEDVLELINLIETNVNAGKLPAGVIRYMKSLINKLKLEMNKDEEELDKDRLLVLLRDVENYAKRKGVKVNESEDVYEGKGYDEARKLIKNLREKVYRKLTDAELEEFNKEMADHLGLSESVLTEADDDDKQSTKRGPIDSAKIEKALKTKSEETGVPIGIIRAIMRRGMAAWKTGHRPGATQEQWGYARVNAFLTKGEGTWGKADKDLAKEVRDGGHDKKLKK